MPVISAFDRRRQEDCEFQFKASLGLHSKTLYQEKRKKENVVLFNPLKFIATNHGNFKHIK
jgi:hypothetical protein